MVADKDLGEEIGCTAIGIETQKVSNFTGMGDEPGIDHGGRFDARVTGIAHLTPVVLRFRIGGQFGHKPVVEAKVIKCCGFHLGLHGMREAFHIDFWPFIGATQTIRIER